MFEPGTSKDASSCMLLNNSSSIINDKKNKDSSTEATKKDLIKSLVSEAASRLNVQYVAKKKLKDLQNETNRKRKSCSALLEKRISSKRQRLSCEGRICDEEGRKVETAISSFNHEEHAQDVNVNDYLAMVNKQLKALQELPIIQKSSTSEIQSFIAKLDESQIETFLKKKMDGMRSSADPNAKSIISFIQKKVILPVYQNRSATAAPSNHGDDASVAGPSSDNCSEKIIGKDNAESKCQEFLARARYFKRKSHESAAKSDESAAKFDESAAKSDESAAKSDESAAKSRLIGTNLANDGSSEVTSTSVVEDENEITSSNGSKVLEKISPSDLLKLTREELSDLSSVLFDCDEGESNSASVQHQKAQVLDPKEPSKEKNKIVSKKDATNFFLWLISFVDMLKTCTNILANEDSQEEEVQLKEERVQDSLSAVQTEKVMEESLAKAVKEHAHCQCCVQSKSKENNSKGWLHRPLLSTTTPSYFVRCENEPSTSTSFEATVISSTTTPDAEIASPDTSLSTPVTKIKSVKVKQENLADINGMSDDTVVKCKEEPPSGEIFKCRKCNYTTKSILKLKRHIKYAKKNPLVYNHKKKSSKKSQN